MAIDIGAAAIDRPSDISGTYTYLSVGNPANADGLLTTLEVWGATGLTGFRVGTCFFISGVTWRCRDAVAIGDVVGGSKQTFSGLSISVQAGDYIGKWHPTGYMEASWSAGAGIRRSLNQANYLNPGAQITYAYLGTSAFSVYGTGVDVTPTVTTDPATSVESAAATLNGTLDDDGGEACDCGFEWGETVAYGNTTPTQSRTTGQTFDQIISGLDPGQTYHFRAVATNAAGTSYGADRTFTTVAAPTLTTNPATSVEAAAATLNGTLDDDGGEACDCGFEWGLTELYGDTTPTQSRTTGQTFAQIISGLDPNKTYHFRAFATNAAGTSYAPDRTFTTLVAAPTVTTDPESAVSAISATLNGTLDDDGGEACDCGFEWGLDTGYGTATPTESKTTGESFSQVIGGLVHGTTYHFRAFATNWAATVYGADRSLTTALTISKAFALAREEL